MIMIPEVQVFAQVAAISAGLIATCCGIAVFTYRSVKHTDNRHLPPSTEVSNRLDQLQQSVDAIAIEVERLAEAQRFTARIEAERELRQALPSQG
jgi:hypothetical protein